MLHVGIDPGKRHVGLCLLSPEAGPSFYEVRTGDLDLTSAIRMIRKETAEFLERTGTQELTVTLERQLSVGAQSSALMFAVQTHILELVDERKNLVNLAMPLPVQLISYLKKRHELDTTSASSIVKGYQEQTKTKTRISQHQVDAYYLAHLGKEVLEGTWGYRLPQKEAPLTARRIMHGVAR